MKMEKTTKKTHKLLLEQQEALEKTAEYKRYVKREEAITELGRQRGRIPISEINKGVQELLVRYPIKTYLDYVLVVRGTRKAAEEVVTQRQELITSIRNRNRTLRGNVNKATQKEKLEVKAEWEKWQKDLARYKNQTQFATAMVSKFRHCTNTQTICRWCREWKSEILLAE